MAAKSKKTRVHLYKLKIEIEDQLEDQLQPLNILLWCELDHLFWDPILSQILDQSREQLIEFLSE